MFVLFSTLLSLAVYKRFLIWDNNPHTYTVDGGGSGGEDCVTSGNIYLRGSASWKITRTSRCNAVKRPKRLSFSAKRPFTTPNRPRRRFSTLEMDNSRARVRPLWRRGNFMWSSKWGRRFRGEQSFFSSLQTVAKPQCSTNRYTIYHHRRTHSNAYRNTEINSVGVFNANTINIYRVLNCSVRLHDNANEKNEELPFKPAKWNFREWISEQSKFRSEKFDL